MHHPPFHPEQSCTNQLIESNWFSSPASLCSQHSSSCFDCIESFSFNINAFLDEFTRVIRIPKL